MCSVSSVIITEDTHSGVKLTHKDSTPDSVSQSLVFPEHLPTVCGAHFLRCNMISIPDPVIPMQRSVLLVPVRHGVTLIPYEVENGTLVFATHHTLELPLQVSGTCQIATLIDLTEVIDWNNLRPAAPPHVIGLCLNDSGTVNIQKMSIVINFMNISSSSLSQHADDSSIVLNSPGTVSNFVSFMDLPLCWAEQVNMLTYYFDRSLLGLFDVTSQDYNAAEEYTMYYEGTSQEFICLVPRQLVRVSKEKLVVYCENMSAVVDTCSFTRRSVENVRYYKATDGGVPYYCSNDGSGFVSVTASGEALILNSTLSTIRKPILLYLLPNESVYFGDCIKNDDEVYFVFTSNLGNVYLVDLQQEHTIILDGNSHTSVFVRHQFYNDSKLILYSNGSSTVLYNASCQTNPYVIVIDHPYHLSLHILSEDRLHYPCICPPLEVNDSSNVETSTGSDSSGDTKEALKFGSIIAGVTLGVLFAVLLLVVVIR